MTHPNTKCTHANCGKAFAEHLNAENENWAHYCFPRKCFGINTAEFVEEFHQTFAAAHPETTPLIDGTATLAAQLVAKDERIAELEDKLQREQCNNVQLEFENAGYRTGERFTDLNQENARLFAELEDKRIERFHKTRDVAIASAMSAAGHVPISRFCVNGDYSPSTFRAWVIEEATKYAGDIHGPLPEVKHG